MFPDPLVALDFETTGLAPEDGDRITEVGLVRIEAGRIVERFSSLVNSGVSIPRSIAAYTGITTDMLARAPAPHVVIPQVLRFIGDCAVVSHNAMFDQIFLQMECRRLDLPCIPRDFLCSMRIARRLYPDVRSPSMADLARHLGLKSAGAAHRALADAEMTAQLVLRMAQQMAVQQPAEGLLPRLSRWSAREGLPAA